MAITFVTTTSHGNWLPGDLRGYVQDGIILPSNPRLLKFSKSLLKSDPVFFSPPDRDRLFESLLAAAAEFNYRLTDIAIESWHLHWIISHGDDPVKTMVGRLKTRMRQSLARGRIWTEGYWSEELRDETALDQVRRYITNHPGCRMTAGKLLR
jgi:REP element-mobilizing transposase RayT